jgi:hypothetical protein
LNALRLLALLLALSLMIGELWRSWGAGRHWLFVFDDQIMGAMLILAAIALRRDTFNRRAFFAAAWGVNAGMLYGSFFGKLVAPQTVNAGNWNMDVLTVLVGVAFVVSLLGLMLSILLPRTGDRR